MKGDVIVKSYQMNFPPLTKKRYENNRKLHDIAVIYIRLEELQEHGAKMIKTGKPTFGGTKITFAPVKTAEEYQRELKAIMRDGEELGLTFEKVKAKEMTRLTEYHCNVAVIKDKSKLGEAMAKLALYEDAEEQGLLLRLPCKVGDIVAVVLIIPSSGRRFTEQMEVKEIKIGKYLTREDIQLKVEPLVKRGATYKYYVSEWGKNIFPTLSEAEEALKKMEK